MVFRNRWLVVIAILFFVTGWILLGSVFVSRAAEVKSAYIGQAIHHSRTLDRGNIAAASRLSAIQAGQDLSINKEHRGDFVIGSDGVYTITVVNAGEDPVTGSITVTDVLTDALTPIAVQGSGWAPCDFSNQTLTCIYSNTGGLNPNQALPPISMTVSLDEIVTAVVTNTATVSNTNDTNPGNNSDIDIANVASADLSVTKTVTPTTPAENDAITYSLVVTNLGPADTSNVVVTDSLPLGVTYVSSQPSQGTYNPDSGLWSVGDLATSSSITLTISASVNPNTRGTTIVNTIEGMASDLSDPIDANNVDSAILEVLSTRVLGLVTDAATEDPIEDVLLTLTDSAGEVYTTTTMVSGYYTFTSTITEPLASGGASLLAAKDGYASETRSFSIVESSDNRQDFDLDTSDLLVTKTDGRSQVIPGQTIEYTMGITNVGTIPATNIVITDELTVNMNYITDTLGITHTNPSTDVFVWELDDDLDPDEGITFTLRASVDTALPSTITVLTNQLEASTESPEANLENNIARDTNNSTGSVIIRITKSVSPNQFRVGENATFTIRVENDGTAPATDLVIRDNFSSYLDIVRADSNRGETTTNSTARRVTVEIDRLNPDQSATITVRVRANNRTTTARTETNNASIEYDFGGDSFDRTSNTISYRILTSTLPGTGGAPIAPNGDDAVSTLIVVSALGALILGIVGIGALFYGFQMRSRESEWASWATRMGLLLTSVAMMFGLLSWSVQDYQRGEEGTIRTARYSPVMREALKILPTREASSDNEDYSWPSESPTNDLDSLPDYPIPTPTVQPTPDGSGESPDTSAITRIVIPVLQVDAVVKYVPFDGLTWIIEGLRHEVAWMGDTSWPGLGGNTVMAGHVTLRSGQEGPFRYLEVLQQKDRILVYTEENMYTYEIRAKRIVGDTDLSVVDSTENSQITLITCTGWDADFETYMDRLVVTADLVEKDALDRRAQDF